MIDPAKIIKADHCTSCHTDHSLEMYDYFNSPVGYSNILSGNARKLDVKNVYILKCRACGKIYPIDWTGNVPMPLRPTLSNLNMEFFKGIF